MEARGRALGSAPVTRDVALAGPPRDHDPSWPSGPSVGANCWVLSTWGPAVWSPLNGVVGGFGFGQTTGSRVSTGVEPQSEVEGVDRRGRRVRVGVGGVWGRRRLPPPGATMNVSMLNRPTNVALALTGAVGLHVALVPGQPEGTVRHLDDEEVELRLRRQSLGLDVHDLDRPLRGDADVRLRVRHAARALTDAAERTIWKLMLLSGGAPPALIATVANTRQAKKTGTQTFQRRRTQTICHSSPSRRTSLRPPLVTMVASGPA